MNRLFSAAGAVLLLLSPAAGTAFAHGLTDLDGEISVGPGGAGPGERARSCA